MHNFYYSFQTNSLHIKEWREILNSIRGTSLNKVENQPSSQDNDADCEIINRKVPL